MPVQSALPHLSAVLAVLLKQPSVDSSVVCTPGAASCPLGATLTYPLASSRTAIAPLGRCPHSCPLKWTQDLAVFRPGLFMSAVVDSPNLCYAHVSRAPRTHVLHLPTTHNQVSQQGQGQQAPPQPQPLTQPWPQAPQLQPQPQPRPLPRLEAPWGQVRTGAVWCPVLDTPLFAPFTCPRIPVAVALDW